MKIWSAVGSFLSKVHIFDAWSRALGHKNFAAIADWFNVWFFGIGILGLGLAWWAAYVDHGYSVGLRVFCLGLLLAGACGMTGWLFGLLFGIPRSLARGGLAAPTGANATILTSKVNTNLEDVSDWLTKTLIGISLSQLVFIPKFLGDLASYANFYGFDWTAAVAIPVPPGVAPHQPGLLLAESIIIYFTAGGFWLGYVGTRTILTGLFDTIDGGLSQTDLNNAKSATNLQIAEVELGTDGVLKADPAIAICDRKLLAMPIQSLGSVSDVVAWSAAQARAGNFEVAQVALEGALCSDPSNDDVRRVLATVYAVRDKFDEANALLRSLPPTRITLFCALYEKPPKGFERAIEVGSALIAGTANSNDVDIRVWLACAYGQKYAFEVAKSPKDNSMLANLRAKVIENVKAAIQIDPAARKVLRAFWKPTEHPEENDLQTFPPNDSELSALLDGP